MGIRGMISKAYRAFWGDKNELNLTIVIVAYVWEYAKKDIELYTLNGYRVCELHLNKPAQE